MSWLKRVLGRGSFEQGSGKPAISSISRPAPKPKDTRDAPLPVFRYYPDPLADGSITMETEICECCEMLTPYICTTLIYSAQTVDFICPWCVADGSAAKKFNGGFQSLQNVPETVPNDIVEIVDTRTPGYSTWQGNNWLFTATDAMIFVGEVDGNALLKTKDTQRIDACLAAVDGWYGDDAEEVLSTVVKGGQLAIYLFQDPETGRFEAYMDAS